MRYRRSMVAGALASAVAVLAMAPDVAGAHFSFVPHSHHVVQILGSHPEVEGPHAISRYCNWSATQSGQFTYTDRFEAKNGYGIGIGFSTSVVSTALRFDVNSSVISEDRYQQPVPPKTCVTLLRSAVYEMTWFLGMTRSLWDDEYAIGYAGRFLYPAYSTDEQSI